MIWRRHRTAEEDEKEDGEIAAQLAEIRVRLTDIDRRQELQAQALDRLERQAAGLQQAAVK